MDITVFEDSFMNNLNENQKKAVRTVEGPVLLLATPGSGKTTVLVKRLGYMICCKNVKPESILAMTYTKAATKDMKERFVHLFGQENVSGLQFRTINGVSAKIIERLSRHTGKKVFEVLTDEAALNQMVRNIYQSLNDEYAEDSIIKDIRTNIAFVKNMMLSDTEIEKLETDTEQFPEIYRRYQLTMRENGYMDYDDQMVYALNVLRKYPDLLKEYQIQFPYLCVDEAQDTSKIQHEMIKLLSGQTGNLFMVGDEDQSIYGFRAAYPEALMNFEKDHPGATILFMEENYRSTPQIIDAANRFVSRNLFRREKQMKPTRKRGTEVHQIFVKDRDTQFRFLMEIGKSCNHETAFLFRNNDSAMPLLDYFEREQIQYNCRNFDVAFFSNRIVVGFIDILRFSYDPFDGELFLKIYYKFGAMISKKNAVEAIEKSRQTGKTILEELILLPGIKNTARDTIYEVMEMLPKIPEDSAETALHRIWEGIHYKKYAEKNTQDTGKFFILCMLAKDVPDVKMFLNKMDSLKKAISSHKNEKENRLFLSTIHSSKGLEYSRVYLVDFLNGILPQLSEEEVEKPEEMKQYEEDRRLCYVAMTRAKDELFFFSFNNKSEFTEEIAGDLPKRILDEKEVFYSLNRPMIGKIFTDQELGTGIIIAQCEELCMIDFKNGKYRMISLEDMFLRRKKDLPLSIQGKASKHNKEKREPWLKLEENQRKANLNVGDIMHHKLFGDGEILAIEGDFFTVRFQKKGIKKLSFSLTVRNGFL